MQGKLSKHRRQIPTMSKRGNYFFFSSFLFVSRTEGDIIAPVKSAFTRYLLLYCVLSLSLSLHARYACRFLRERSSL